MRRHAVRVLRLSVGGALLLLGVVGLFVPILQGWLFIFAGLSVMAPESPTARRALDAVKRRFRRHGASAKDQVVEPVAGAAPAGGRVVEAPVSQDAPISSADGSRPVESAISDRRVVSDER